MLTSLFLLGVAAAGLGGGIQGADGNGESPEYWKRAAVVYAEVVDVDKNAPGWRKIRLKPLATITGELDSASHDLVDAVTWIGNESISLIYKVPTKGTKVIVLLEGGRDIPNGNAIFFPEERPGIHPAMFEVTGFDDPKVTETIENLRKLRGKQREEAEKKAAAEPKSKP